MTTHAWHNVYWRDGYGPSPALKEIAQRRLDRLDRAIALGTCHQFRLRDLRARLVERMAGADGMALSLWLADYGAAIAAECRAAERTENRV